MMVKRLKIKNARKNFLFAAFFLSGVIMIGHGARMIYQGLFKPDSYYPAPTPGTVDFYFDWLTLLILGIIVLSFSIYTFYYMQEKKQKSKKEEKMFLNPS